MDGERGMMPCRVPGCQEAAECACGKCHEHCLDDDKPFVPRERK